MGTASERGFHQGTRGRTDTDQAQREHLAGRHRLMAALSTRMTELAGPDGWLLVGGPSTAAHEALAALPHHAARRSRVLSDLRLRATSPEITRAASAGARDLHREEDLAAIRDTLEVAGAGGRAARGAAATLQALNEGRVTRVFLSKGFIERSPADAEQAIHAAFEGRATVESVADGGAELLDAEAGGIAVTLRYTLR